MSVRLYVYVWYLLRDKLQCLLLNVTTVKNRRLLYQASPSFQFERMGVNCTSYGCEHVGSVKPALSVLLKLNIPQ